LELRTRDKRGDGSFAATKSTDSIRFGYNFDHTTCGSFSAALIVY
jgi:hypothetical protein